MNLTSFPETKIVGIFVRTTNENNQSALDIPALWNRWFSEQAIMQIPDRVDDTLYCIYTDYEKDFTRPYTTILGCAVTNIESVPNNFAVATIGGNNFAKYSAKGKIMEGIVIDAWIKIWNEPLNRAYIADFEVYGAKAKNPDNAEVDIYVGLK